MRFEISNIPGDSSDIVLHDCGYRNYPSNHREEHHQQREYFIFCTTEGDGYIKTNHFTYHLKTNDCFLISPGEEYQYNSSSTSSWSFFWFSFSGQNVNNYLKMANLSQDHPITPLNGKTVTDLKQRIFKVAQLVDIGDRKEEVRLELYQMLSLLAGKCYIHEHSPSKIDNYIQKSLIYIDHNYQNFITVNDIVMYVNLNRSYFTKIFKSRTGQSPQQYLLNVRIKKAMELIDQTDLNFNEICNQVGIREGHYFWRVFKQHAGISPTEYKNRYTKI